MAVVPFPFRFVRSILSAPNSTKGSSAYSPEGMMPPVRSQHSRIRSLLLCGLVFAPGCDSATSSDGEPAEMIWISATRLVLSPQDTTRIGLITLRNGQYSFSSGIRRDPSLDTGPSGVWSTSDAEVVTVQPGGLLQAGSAGDAIITVRSGQLVDSARVFVRESSATSTDFTDVDVGLARACARNPSGALYCWGISWFGESGLGTIRRFTATASPARVQGLQSVSQFSVGLRHSCAIDTTGRVYCWGEDLAAGTSNPLPVPIPTESRFTMISAGGTLTCGITVDQRLFCWGLGLAGIQEVTTPMPLVRVSSGYSHACGLSAVGSAFCFGTNSSGQLGTGDRVARTDMTAVNANASFLSVSAGFDYTCAVSSDARAYCWGSGVKGRLGTGLTTTFESPVAVVGLTGVATIDAGSGHTCAVKANGAAYCWGEEFRGQLGNGPPPTPRPNAEELIQLSPVQVSLAMPVRTISAGWGESTCAVSVSAQTFCWGLNTNGQLGTGRHDFAAGSSFRFSDWPLAVRFVP